jgi:hypothetical protein
MVENHKALLTREQWEGWHRQAETAAFRDFLRASIAEAKDAWAQGAFTDGKDAFQLAVANAAAVENIRVVQQLIDMDYDEYLTQMKGDE